MTDAFQQLTSSAHSLAQYSGSDSERTIQRMCNHYPAASSGERVMIRAALSCVPRAWLPEEAADVDPFRISDCTMLDNGNAVALLRALAVQLGIELR